MNKYKYIKEGIEFRKLRIKAGFTTMREAATHANVHYRTWQNWELGITLSPNIVDMYLELYIQSKKLES